MRHLRSGLLGVLALSLLLSAIPVSGADSDIEGRVNAAYPGILAFWADGQRERAIEELDALESSLIRPKRADQDVEALWRAKLAVVRGTIERSSVEVLVPIMLLHHDAYLHYVAERSSRLAAHSQVMSAELADFYAENSSDPSAAVRASDLLTSLGGHLQSRQVMRRSAILFARALELDPANAAAHVGLGALYEWRAELTKAKEHYATAARLDPESGEALLRYGICAARQGELREAEKQFDRVLALGDPDWIVKLAFQEKARLQEEPSEGTGVARQGRERFPESSRQAIQLAFMLERQRQSRLALEVLDDMSGVAEPESERYRYARWPTTLLVAVRARLREAAQAESAVLTSASSNSMSMRPGE